MKKITVFFFLVAFFTISGCGFKAAIYQPPKKDLGVLEEGTHRDMVRAELGKPVSSGKEGDLEYDTFDFIQGYSSLNRTSRAIFHGVADFFTLGLWEFVATPIEMINSGKKMAVRVIYNKEGKVVKVEGNNK